MATALGLLGACLIVAGPSLAATPDKAAAPQKTAGRPAADTHPRIDDRAGILDPFVPRLGRMLDSFHDDLGIEVHIVTSADGGTSIEEQADATFQARKTGVAAPTGGLLVLLNPSLRRARIEVGYSLEGAFTDLHMGRIARDQLAPYASYGAAGMAAMDVVHYLRNHAYASAALGNLDLDRRYKAKPAYEAYAKYASGGAGAQARLSSVDFDADLKAPVPTGRRSRYLPAADVHESVAAFIRASTDLAGDPSLDLFTEGSRLMRRHYPFARFEEMQRLERLQASMPFEIAQRGDHAVANSSRRAQGFVPVLLQREQGLWRVDLVETWKNLFFDERGNYFLRNENTPYAFGLADFGRARSFDIAPVPLGGRTIQQALDELRARKDVVSTLRRAEIWLRNAFVFPRAFLAYEEARRKAPHDPLVLQTIGERAVYLGFAELAIPALQSVGSGVELDLAMAYEEMGDLQGARRTIARALAENPYDWYALHREKWLAQKSGDAAAQAQAEEAIAILGEDGARRTNQVTLTFSPATPKFDASGTLNVGGTTVYDHSNFGVTIRNTSRQPVQIASVTLRSVGTAAASGLGDIRSYWQWPRGSPELRPGEAVKFDKQWGFTVDTGHEHVRYVFRTCWRGQAGTTQQCRTQWVDTLP